MQPRHIRPNLAILHIPHDVKREWRDHEQCFPLGIPSVQFCFGARTRADGTHVFARHNAHHQPMTQVVTRAIRLTGELFAAILVPNPILHTRNHVARNSGLISMQRAVVTNCMVLIINGTATHFQFTTDSKNRAEFWLEQFPGDHAGHKCSALDSLCARRA